MKAFLWFMAGTIAGEVMRQVAAKIRKRIERAQHPEITIDSTTKRPWSIARDEGQPKIQPPERWPRK